MNDTVKKYLIQETELCILLALKGVRTLYGICLDSTETMTQEELYYNLFIMQKKGIISRRADSGEIWIGEELDSCIERIRTAARFIVLADADELVPEKYFYVARKGAVMLESAGQYDARQRTGLFMWKQSRRKTCRTGSGKTVWQQGQHRNLFLPGTQAGGGLLAGG